MSSATATMESKETNKEKTPYLIRYPLTIYDDETLQKDMLKPLTYNTSDRKNKVKQHLMSLLAVWLEVPNDKMEIFHELIFYIYNSTLILDDLEDNSILRRGKPTSHRVFGITRAILAINFTQITTYDLVQKVGSKEVFEKLLRALPKLLGGQGMEIYWRDKNICPTIQEHLFIIYMKTCVAFQLAAEVMGIFGKRKWSQYEKLMTIFGYYYQINDDYQNLRSKVYYDEKGFADDLSEGKYSFSIIHAINNFPQEGKIIHDIMKERTHDAEKKKYCLSLLEETGSFAHTEKTLKELKELMFAEIRKIDDDPMLRQFLETAVLSYL